MIVNHKGRIGRVVRMQLRGKRVRYLIRDDKGKRLWVPADECWREYRLPKRT